MYRFFSEIAGARIETVRYDDGDAAFRWRRPCARLQRAPRILFLANPNNPTGTLLDQAALRAHPGCRAANAGAGGRGLLRICGRDGAAVDSPRRESGGVAHIFEGGGLGGAAAGCAFRARRAGRCHAARVYAVSGEFGRAGGGRGGAGRPEISAPLRARRCRQSRWELAQGLAAIGRARFSQRRRIFCLVDFGPGGSRLVRRLARREDSAARPRFGVWPRRFRAHHRGHAGADARACCERIEEEW